MNKFMPLYLASATDTAPEDLDGLGLAQFEDFESLGLTPTNPHPYFLHILGGKKWFEWTINMYASQYGKWEWPGFHCLALDMLENPLMFKALTQRLRRSDVKFEDLVGSHLCNVLMESCPKARYSVKNNEIIINTGVLIK